MNQPAEQQKPEKTSPALTERLQEAIEAFQRSDINLPKAIIVAAVIIALGIMLS